jgi:hypothetical protein
VSILARSATLIAAACSLPALAKVNNPFCVPPSAPRRTYTESAVPHTASGCGADTAEAAGPKSTFFFEQVRRFDKRSDISGALAQADDCI